jgi:hypothetical protein
MVEVAQLTVIHGRDPSIGDVLFNATGVLVGVALAALVPTLASLDDRTAARLSVAAALDVTLAVLLTAWLLQPSFPSTTYWGQWTPRFGHLEWYRGRVHSARVDGLEVRPRRIEESAWAREALLAGKPIEVEATAGPPVSRLSSLFSVNDEKFVEIVLLGPDREDLVYRYRTRASSWGLDQPDLRLPAGMRGIGEGDRLSVRAWAPERGSLCLSSSVAEACELRFGIGTGWAMLLYPESLPGSLKSLLGMAWAGALVLPLGFLLRRRWESAVAAGIALFAVGLLPQWITLRPTTTLEWAGIALGLAVGGASPLLARGYRLAGRPRR